MKKLITVLFCILFANQYLFAGDITITVLEKNSKNTVKNVTIEWEFLNNNRKKGKTITNINGIAKIPIDIGEKIIVQASRIGYKTLIDTIITKKENIIKLEKELFNLSPIIVTGYGKPMPIDSSLYNVRIIDKQKILNSGVTNLGDLFLTEPNIDISNDLILGTQLEMFGMSGRNVKIMIDGIPVIGRLNGQIDLSQITLNNIDHIEIIEGPMSVVYGNNALAGTVNIITYKNKDFNTDIKVSAEVEHPNKYNIGANLSQKINKNIFSLSGDFSNFKGVDFNKKDRSMDWKPQQKYSLEADYLLKLNHWDFSIKGSLYSNKTTVKGNVQNYRAFDNYFFTDRYTGATNLSGSWNKNNHLSILLSYSYYQRSSQDVTKDLTTLQEVKQEKITSQTEKNTLLRTIWNHSLNKIPLNIESGIDFNLSTMEGMRIKNKEQSLNDYAAFVNVRYKLLQNLRIQPGVRFAYNTSYKTPILYSFNAKWNILKNLSWRASVAKGFRAPTVKELYYKFVDSNHEIYGNNNLKAEESDSYNTSLDYKYKWRNNCLAFNTQLYYNNSYNLITLINKQNSTGYQYNNISRYKTRGGSLGATFYYKNILKVSGSSNITGRYNNLGEVEDIKKFNTTIDWVTGIQFKEIKTQIQLNADLKLYGKRNYFYYDSKDNIKEGNIEKYQILNISLSRAFLKNRLRMTLGSKNLMNIKDIYLSGNTQSSGHSTGNGIPIAYGTSYFAKVIFNITK